MEENKHITNFSATAETHILAFFTPLVFITGISSYFLTTAHIWQVPLTGHAKAKPLSKRTCS